MKKSMATLTLSNKILEKHVSLLKVLDTDSKRKIIARLTESLDTKEEKVDSSTLFGAWEDNRTSDEIINDIRESRIEKAEKISFE
ncbi:hypothetical protein [Algoriphagus sp.]|uniref:hypothetical protein n=1 Tax=Algoriphagus sp. TaxID=1872435 RepID=UPI003918A10E